MKRSLILLFVVASVFQSCYNRKLLGSTQYPGQISKQFYKLSDEVNGLGNHSLIDTTAIYLHEGAWTMGGTPQEHILYMFMRFSGNGVVFLSTFSSYRPTEIQFESMPDGEFCFYRLDGNKIIIESFDYHLKLFKFLHGVVDKEKIVFTDYKIRTFGGGKGSLDNFTVRKRGQALKSIVQFPSK